uniref:Peroxidase n=1 Tax=Megaselia scalaris TaxID=36166 RepID=T1GP47_MEGSC
MATVKKRPIVIEKTLNIAAKEGLNYANKIYNEIEPNILKNQQILEDNHPASLLSKFSEPTFDNTNITKSAYAALFATKAFRRREPCGLSPIESWEDLAKVVGSESAKRINFAYKSVHDIDLFVGGISERPVIGGIVGPTFACIIAQQFSNLRKGDRFWYENSNLPNSFTLSQLNSIRHVSFAQILCRTMGGGTLQPHVFLPHEIKGNERTLCGIGPLAPIDLRPWV